MEAICDRGDTGCQISAFTAALHALHFYCTLLTVMLICCCDKLSTRTSITVQWRWQNVRGVANLGVGISWIIGAAAAALRPSRSVPLASAMLAPAGWFAAAWLYGALWKRTASAPVLYLFLYWLLSATAAAAMIFHYVASGDAFTYINTYIHISSFIFCLTLTSVDGICFFGGVANRIRNKSNNTIQSMDNYTYRHEGAYFFSKITFFWINQLLWKCYKAPIEQEDLGDLPEDESSLKHYNKFKDIFKDLVAKRTKHGKGISMWRCYLKMVWPNFYLSGIMKLFGDMLGLVPPMGLSVVVQYIVGSNTESTKTEATFQEFISNGYIMIAIITISAIGQAFLSQNSTHLVSVEGIRLKTALQSMIFDKCMRLAPWASEVSKSEEKEPLLNVHDDTKQTYSGMLTNLVSQDTYNIMSCVWVCHYLWAIPLKVAAILYLLHNKLGISAMIGCAASILFITPLQFYIGKKISDNAKTISKTSDHRISKMTEILQGITVIKLYVWEDLFKEKILCLREVELKLLNKDSVYWGILSFTTQVSTILVTIITFTVYYYVEDSKKLSAVNVFAGLALFSQLSIPLLVLPVTVLMVVQATISTKRIKEFLELPESFNTNNYNEADNHEKINCDKFNDAFIEIRPVDSFRITENRLKRKKRHENRKNNDEDSSDEDVILNTVNNNKLLLKLKNVVCTWGGKISTSIEIDDLEISTGKLIMVIGPTGSGKSSLLAAILGEMDLNGGDIIWNGSCSKSYLGQPPWLLESTVRDNIVMENSWNQRRYARVLRSTGLKPDLQLLPEGDRTVLGTRGSPLSGGQRVRVCVARALYSQAQLLVLDEPLGALDAALARHVVARGLVTAARSGRTILLATNRLELLHYADMIVIMEDCRVVSWRKTADNSVIRRWNQLAAEARTTAARVGAGPCGGTARERSRLVRVLSRNKLQRTLPNEISVGVNEATGAHLLAEVPTYTAGSWRRAMRPPPPPLIRQLSSPPPSSHQLRWRRDIRRVVSADATDTTLKREASLLRRLLSQRPHRTLSRWTPRPIRRLLSNSNNTTSVQLNGDVVDVAVNGNGNGEALSKSMTTDIEDQNDDDEGESQEADEPENVEHVQVNSWWEYGRACGWWGVAYWCAATSAQALAVSADWCLTKWTVEQNHDDDKIWQHVYTYAVLCACGAAAAACAQAAATCGGGAARRVLHERLLTATLYATLPHHERTPIGHMLHTFSSDIMVIDKKLTTTVCRWSQLALLCGAALMVVAAVAPWSLLAAVPAAALYLMLQNVYRRNAREIQRLEAASAAPSVSMVAEVLAGAAEVRAGRLQDHMRNEYLKRLDRNHNALLILNATNRWLGLSLDIIGALSVCAGLSGALCGGRGAALAGLAGAYSLLLPTYLAHLAKARADLDLHLCSVERVHMYACVAQDDYREHCVAPDPWLNSGEVKLDHVTVQHGPRTPTLLSDVTLTIKPGEKVAVCGRSGCGKSTLLLSCVGAAPITSGELRIGGILSDRLPLRALRHRLVVLPQETALFSGTLRENLDPVAVHTDQEIWQSLKVVGLHDSVTAHPSGLECSVGGSYCAWRGSRAARVCAARAALRAQYASCLLLDEPGAAFDAGAERTLLAAIADAAPNTTIITVAHRVSSVRNYDRIIVIDAGRVVEQGAPAELLAEPTSRFARMFAAAVRDHHNMSRTT